MYYQELENLDYFSGVKKITVHTCPICGSITSRHVYYSDSLSIILTKWPCECKPIKGA